MIVGTLRLSLRLHACRSLKEKRAPRRSLVARIRNRWSVAVAEVDDQDTWNLLTLGVAAIGPDKGPIEAVLREIADFAAEGSEGELIAETVTFLRP